MLPVPLRRSGNPLHLRVRVRVWRGRVGLGLVASLSVLAGMTDAIGFLATGDFVSFMSGNTTRLFVSSVQEENIRDAILKLLALSGPEVAGRSAVNRAKVAALRRDMARASKE